MQNLFSLADQRVLITGAAGGIGASVARVCGFLGAETILVDRATRVGIVEEVSSRGFGTPAIQCDQQDRTAVEAVCDGAGQTHAAILNAAVNPYNDWEAEDWNESFQEIMAINVLGALSTFREPRYRPCRRMAVAASC